MLKNVFKSGKVWGYSFKEIKINMYLRFDLRYGIHDNEPGKVIKTKAFLCYITTRIMNQL